MERQVMPNAADRVLTFAHLGNDINTIISFHKSCGIDKLKNNQITYMQQIMKSVDMSPLDFLIKFKDYSYLTMLNASESLAVHEGTFVWRNDYVQNVET